MRLKDLRTKCWRYNRKIAIAIVVFSSFYCLLSIMMTKNTRSTPTGKDVQGAFVKVFQGQGGKDGNLVDLVARKDSSRKIHKMGQNFSNDDKNEEDFSSSSSNSVDNQPSAEKGDNKPMKRLPQAIIIGVKKGGTRALLNFISLHPDVEAAKHEVHFFDRNYEKGIEWYRDQMPLSRPGQITLEKTPGYFITEDAPKRIRDLDKDVKLIVVFREPVTRALSDFAQSIATGRRKDGEFDHLAIPDPKTGKVDGDWYALHVSTYDRHLKQWYKYFPREQFVFINGDDLIQNPAPQLIKLQKFLNIDTIIDESYFVFNATKGFYCIRSSKEGEETECLGNTKGRAHPQISPSVFNSLKQYFKPHNENLYTMTGENFHWNDDDR